MICVPNDLKAINLLLSLILFAIPPLLDPGNIVEINFLHLPNQVPHSFAKVNARYTLRQPLCNCFRKREISKLFNSLS